MVPKELAKPQPPKLTDLSRSKRRSEWVSHICGQGDHFGKVMIKYAGSNFKPRSSNQLLSVGKGS